MLVELVHALESAPAVVTLLTQAPMTVVCLLGWYELRTLRLGVALLLDRAGLGGGKGRG